MQLTIRFAFFLLLSACSCLAPTPALAQEAHAVSEAEHEHKNAFGLMLGGTYEEEEGEAFFTVGLDYARLISHRFHMTVVVEHIDTIDAWVTIAPVHIFPWRESGFFFALGPGIEHKSRRVGATEHAEELEEGHGEMPSEHGQAEDLFLWRTGIGYDLRFGKRIVVAPGLDWDVVREHGRWVNAFVFDVAFGFGF